MTYIAMLLFLSTALVTALSQAQTNGKSALGTLKAPKYPEFLTNNPVVHGYPWGSKDSSNSDSYSQGPNTGVVRYYDFTLTRGTLSPDGFEKSTFLVNGQFPGPTINANWGDTIEVTVHNQISSPAEGTSLHWHGIRQQGTEWMDGVPTVSICPIVPGGSYTYRFRANAYGTTWYHSHYSSQYIDGLWGALIINGPKNAKYDTDLGPVALSDYYHSDYYTVLEGVMGTDFTKFRPASDNNLINGKMNYKCGNVTGTCNSNAPLAKFQFTSGKIHRLRLINTGSAGLQKFSIDNHTLTVIANDFTPVEPYDTTVVTLAVGQRTDVIVKAVHKPTDSFWIRSNLTSGDCTEPANQPHALAIVYYENANQNTTAGPTSKAHVDTSDPCDNDPLSITVPSYKTPVTTPSITTTMEVNFVVNATGHLVWTVDNSTYRGDLGNPLLLLAKAGNHSYKPDSNIYDFGTNSSVRIIINNKTPTSHPWHLHAHEMQILASGAGEWDGTVINPNNPQRRDVHLLPAKGYLVIQYSGTNPGIWPFHCHIAWHLSAGLYVNILENSAAIRDLAVPSTAYQVCRDWAAYRGERLVEQIDSGI